MLGNPIEAFIQAEQAKNQNRRDMYGDIAGLGQGLGETFGSIGSMIGEQKKKALIQQIVQAMQTQGAPQQGPPLAPVGTPQPNLSQIPPGQPMSAGGNIGQDVQMPQPIPTQGPGQPSSGIGAPAQDNTQLIKSLLMKADPQGMMSQMEGQMFPKQLNPLQQAEADYYKARANKLNQPSPPPGQLTPQQDLRAKYIDAIHERTGVMAKSLNARQIDNLAKTTGLQPTVVKQLQTNNIRADRALSVLDDPKATWSALNGWVSTDFAGIMQGGAPQKEQILDSQFPNWKAKVSQIRTYFGSQPEGPIDPGFRDYMKHFVRTIKEIDNDYLWKNAQFQGNMIGPTIQGGEPFVKKSQDFTKGFMSGGLKQQGGNDQEAIQWAKQNPNDPRSRKILQLNGL